MKKIKSKDITDDLRPEYDFDYSKAVRGKHAKRLLEEGSNIVVLEPDIARNFKSSEAVNTALRSLLEITRETRSLTQKRRSRAEGNTKVAG